ncbi:MAG: MJ0042-type zinc finger domain-containing protein [Fimbriiglobus sp.]
MIRFSCPGCAAAFTVDDSKAGKAGKCPKCESQFVIPEAEGSPAPSTSAESNEAVEINPCPKCNARLTVAASDLGLDVECPHCKTVYPATRPGAKKPGTGSKPSLSDVMSGKSKSQLNLPEKPTEPTGAGTIRFACPGCNAEYAVSENKAGKTGTCPKCSAKFLIPGGDAEAEAPASPPPPSPSSGRKSSFAGSSLDDALKSGSSGRRSRPDDDEDEDESPRARKRRRDDDDDEDEAPVRRSRRRAEDDDDEDDDREETTRRRKRNRRSSRSSSGRSEGKKIARIVSAILSILSGVGYIGCGILVMVASTFVLSLVGAAGKSPNAPAGANAGAAAGAIGVFIGCGVCMLVFAALYLFAGIGALMRKGYARALTIVVGVLAALGTLFGFFSVVMALIGGNFGSAAINFVTTLVTLVHCVASFMATIGDGADQEFNQ